MKIKGHFFMWQLENGQIPFRFFDGEIYVAMTHPVILDKTNEQPQNKPRSRFGCAAY